MSLPDPWQAVPAGDGRTYFWNPHTNETRWDAPVATPAPAPVPAPAAMPAPGGLPPPAGLPPPPGGAVGGGGLPPPPSFGGAAAAAPGNTDSLRASTNKVKRMCEACGTNKAAVKVNELQPDGTKVLKLLCKPCVIAKQAPAAAAAPAAAGGHQPQIKIGKYKPPADTKKKNQKAILDREWGLTKKESKGMSPAQKKAKLDAQVVELKKERRKCDNCDKKARVKVTGVDGVARWLCKDHGQNATSGGSLPRGSAQQSHAPPAAPAMTSSLPPPPTATSSLPPPPSAAFGAPAAPTGAAGVQLDTDPCMLGYARAHTRFVPEGEGELGLEVGDIVCVLTRDPDGWWKGILKGRRAYFPANHCDNYQP
eukprot:TRINITY_DN3866_c0_g1_i1.p2 TRINITY_DN3866_c0_g1~~TRINITY_DN3866_c0_g1_i1.p2  ORF type:complete len:366 (-),score=119.31 TRINITY_DN3866_c0_g1_i1:56-1153(-)